MGTGVPQVDLPVIATGEELRLPRMNSQTPELIGVTLERKEDALSWTSDFKMSDFWTTL